MTSALEFAVVVLCIASAPVTCGPVPQQQPKNDGGRQEQKQEDQQRKHAVDHFTNGLVGNTKIRENYLNCFLDNGPCSPEASTVKQLLPDAIQKECAHCTDLQKKVIEKMMCYLNNHQPEILRQVAAKFDPNGVYIQQYIKTLEQKSNEPEYLIAYVSQPPQQNPKPPQQNPQPAQQNPQPPQPNTQPPPKQNTQPTQQIPQPPQQNLQPPQQTPQQAQQNPQPAQQPQQNQQQSNTAVITSSPIATVVTPKP